MIAVTFPIAGGDFASAGAASRGLKEQLKHLGVEGEVLRRIMIAAYEAEMNVIIHAQRGNLWARLNSGRIDLEVVDEGPGIPDVELAMREGWSTAPEEARALGFGAGMGLPNIRKASDLFEIDSRPGKGTRVRSTIHLRKLAAAETLHNAIAIRPEPAAAAWPASPPARPGRCACATGGPTSWSTCASTARPAWPPAATARWACGRTTRRTSRPPWPPPACWWLPLPFLAGFPQAGPRRVLEAPRARARGRCASPTSGRPACWSRRSRYTRGPDRRATGPVLAPVCPAVVNLVETHFPSLLPQLAPYLSPVEAARDEYSLQALAVVAACPEQYIALHPGSLPGRLRVLSPDARQRRPSRRS